MGKEDVFISQGKRPIWHQILAAASFTIVIIGVYLFIKEIEVGKISEAPVFLMVFCFLLGVRYSVVNNYYFDFEKKQYKIEKTIGPIRYGYWKDFQLLEYVSVFLNAKSLYEINLWYNRNKHFNIGTIDDFKLAIKQGKMIAKKLDIDLLDAATDPRDSKWVDL